MYLLHITTLAVCLWLSYVGSFFYLPSMNLTHIANNISTFNIHRFSSNNTMFLFQNNNNMYASHIVSKSSENIVCKT